MIFLFLLRLDQRREHPAYNSVKEELRGDLFYYDSKICLGEFDRFKTILRRFTSLVLLNCVVKIFSKNKFRRRAFLNLYKYIMINVMHFNFKCLIDFFYLVIMFRSGISYDSYKEKIVARYIKYIDRC